MEDNKNYSVKNTISFKQLEERFYKQLNYNKMVLKYNGLTWTIK
jgi:hypothetical protein